jgi:hypothetical protein
MRPFGSSQVERCIHTVQHKRGAGRLNDGLGIGEGEAAWMLLYSDRAATKFWHDNSLLRLLDSSRAAVAR